MKNFTAPVVTFIVGFLIAGTLAWFGHNKVSNQEIRTMNALLQNFYFMTLDLIHKGEYQELIKRIEYNACAYYLLPESLKSESAIERTDLYFREKYPDNANKCDK